MDGLLSNVNSWFAGWEIPTWSNRPGNRYILRVYRSSHRNRVQIGAEVDLLLALQRAEVPVSFPIPDHAGEYIQSIPAAEGQRYAVLFSYAAGRSVPY
jgi:Ser/Thr protein kinase RdoA (MazF antagonist)